MTTDDPTPLFAFAQAATITYLFSLAQELEKYANAATEQLDFDAYANLSAYETKLLAYGNLMASSNRDAFLSAEIREAEDYFAYAQRRYGRQQDEADSD